MVIDLETGFPFVELKLRGREEDYPLLLDVTSFLYDINLLYEFARLTVDPEYSGYTFSREYSWNRNNRPLAEFDRLRVVELRHESPIWLVVAVAAVPSAVAAVWGIVQTAEKITNWKLNREILKLQRDKLAREAASTKSQLPTETVFRRQLERRESAYFYDRTTQRLQQSHIQISEIEVEVVRRLPPKNSEE
jgi:hypothetical protein